MTIYFQLKACIFHENRIAGPVTHPELVSGAIECFLLGPS